MKAARSLVAENHPGAVMSGNDPYSRKRSCGFAFLLKNTCHSETNPDKDISVWPFFI